MHEGPWVRYSGRAEPRRKVMAPGLSQRRSGGLAYPRVAIFEKFSQNLGI